MSSPRKEQWLGEYGLTLDVPLVMGVGGSSTSSRESRRERRGCGSESGWSGFIAFFRSREGLPSGTFVTNARFILLVFKVWCGVYGTGRIRELSIRKCPSHARVGHSSVGAFTQQPVMIPVPSPRVVAVGLDDHAVVRPRARAVADRARPRVAQHSGALRPAANLRGRVRRAGDTGSGASATTAWTPAAVSTVEGVRASERDCSYRNTPSLPRPPSATTVPATPSRQAPQTTGAASLLHRFTLCEDCDR